LTALLLLAMPVPAASDCAHDDGSPISLHPDYGDGARYRGIRLLGSLRLRERSVDGQPAHGLSGLSWSAAQQRLIVVSDRGFLVHLRPHIAGGHLVGASYCAAYPLRDANGNPLRGRGRDAEGLSLRPASATSAEELLVAFEQRPRIARYSLDGRYLGELPLPTTLRSPARYVSPNRALEALTETRRFGVIVAPELPWRDAPASGVPLFSLGGPSWRFRTLDADYSGVVGMETLPDDNLLVLERRFISLLHPLIIALSRVTLPDLPGQSAGQDEIARFDTTQGWAMDNFESLARHEGNRYFMISDDNASPLQHSLLVYFEVLADDAGPPPAELPVPPFSRHRL